MVGGVGFPLVGDAQEKLRQYPQKATYDPSHFGNPKTPTKPQKTTPEVIYLGRDPIVSSC